MSKIKPSDETAPFTGRRLIGLLDLGVYLDYAPSTIDQMVREGRFPNPIVAKPGSPRKWDLRAVDAWIEQKKRARHTKPVRGGILKQFQAKTNPAVASPAPSASDAGRASPRKHRRSG